jgi:ribonuclease P protein component
VTAGGSRLPRRARLNAQQQFTGRFAQDLQGYWFRILARPNHLDSARLGLIVGRRAAARAVDRSLAKRLAREQFRRVRSRLPGVDVLVRLKAAVPREERSAASAELQQLLGRLCA